MRRPIRATRNALRRLFLQRCFYLFAMLLVLVVAVPLIDAEPRGILIANLTDTLIIVSVVAAVGRTMLSFLAALCLAVPTVVLRWLSLESEVPGHFDLSLKLHVVMYVLAIALLLRYTFDRAVMTADRLWGAAAAYLMIGILWSFLYAIVERTDAASFSVRGEAKPLAVTDLIYFSFSTLTTTGFGDVVPLTRMGRSAAVLESIAGQLFIAILIAKLVGVYPPPRKLSARYLRKLRRSKAGASRFVRRRPTES